MEFNDNAEQLLKYLDKSYYIREKKFFRYYDDIQEWGYEINTSLSTIFGFDNEFCENIFKNWIYAKEFTEEDLTSAWGHRKLKATWSPEMVQDLQAYGIINAEDELVRALSQEIAREIDAQILTDLFENKI
jgi:hypothetical protein